MFVKDERLCRNCLTAHKGDCTFRNRHSCNDKQPHHAYLCSNNATERKIGGVNFGTYNYESTVENVVSILEDLGIEPCEFTEVIGHDIFSDVFQDEVGDYDSSDSEDDGSDVHVGSIGGMNTSKIAQ